MATIRKEIDVLAPPAAVWDVIRDFGAVHRRLFPGVLTDSRLDGDGARTVTFANGLVVRELPVTLDEPARRLVYTAVGGRTAHHNSSLQVLDSGDGQSTVVWTTDLLPDELAPAIEALVEAGAADLRRTLESG